MLLGPGKTRILQSVTQSVHVRCAVQLVVLLSVAVTTHIVFRAESHANIDYMDRNNDCLGSQIKHCITCAKYSMHVRTQLLHVVAYRLSSIDQTSSGCGL